MASGGLRADTTFHPGLLYQGIGVEVVVMVDKKTTARHMLDTTTILHILHTSSLHILHILQDGCHILDTSVHPSTLQYIPVQPGAAQYSPVQPSTAQYRQVPPSTAQYRPAPPRTAQFSYE